MLSKVEIRSSLKVGNDVEMLVEYLKEVQEAKRLWLEAF